MTEKTRKTALGHWQLELMLQCPYCDSWQDEDDDNIPYGKSFRGRTRCRKCGKFFSVHIDGP